MNWYSVHGLTVMQVMPTRCFMFNEPSRRNPALGRCEDIDRHYRRIADFRNTRRTPDLDQFLGDIAYKRFRLLLRQVVCLSARLSVTLRYRDQIGWNSSKIIDVTREKIPGDVAFCQTTYAFVTTARYRARYRPVTVNGAVHM